jgi:hypothetical protein
LFCFYNFQLWMWGLKIAVSRSLELKQCYSCVLKKCNELQAASAHPLSSNSSHLSEVLSLVSKCSEMLDQAQARSVLFQNMWTVPVAHPAQHSSTCGVCMDDLVDAEARAVCCPSRHAFHVTCLEDFMVFSSSASCQQVVCCPYCRFKLPNS